MTEQFAGFFAFCSVAGTRQFEGRVRSSAGCEKLHNLFQH